MARYKKLQRHRVRVLLRDLETCNGISCLCCDVLFSNLKTLLFRVIMFYYTIIINMSFC